MTARLKTIVATALTAGALAAGGAMAPAHAAGTPEHQYTDGAGTLQTPNFKVTMTEMRHLSTETAADVEVCATNVAPGDRVRVSRDPWMLTTTDGVVRPDAAFSTYPTKTQGVDEVFLAQGECTTGSLHFETAGKHATGLDYQNSMGETASFRLDS